MKTGRAHKGVHPSAVQRTEARLGLKLPPGYLEALGAGLRSNRWQLFSLDELQRLDDILETPVKAVLIAEDVGGDALCLLVDKDEPTQLLDPVYFRDHETGRVRRIAADLATMQKGPGRHPRVSIASLEREQGKRMTAPPKDPASELAVRVRALIDAAGVPRASAMLAAARGDAADYLRLVYTQGAVSDTYAAWKLQLSEDRVRSVAAAVLEANAS